MTDFQNTISYSIDSMDVAALDITANSYGTPASMLWVQGFEPDSQIADDDLMNRGALERSLSVLTHYEGTIMGAGLQAAILAILQGSSNSLSGTTPNQVRLIDINGGTNAPYWGCIAHLPIDQSGVLLWGFAMCQLSNRLSGSMEQNQFVVPELEFRALRYRNTDGTTTLPIAKLKVYETDPGAITDFDAWFGMS